jgi:leucyl aminopeptidase
MKIKFAATASGDAVAVPAYDKAVLSNAARALDEASGGALTRALDASRFKGGVGDVLVLTAPAGVEASRLVIYGLGKSEDVSDSIYERAAGHVVKALLTTGAKTLSFTVDGDSGEAAARAGLGARLAAYRFDKYRTKLEDSKKPSLTDVKSSPAMSARRRPPGRAGAPSPTARTSPAIW